MQMKRKHIILITLAFFLAASALWIYYDNQRIVTTRHTLHFDRLPAAFDGFTIAQISDLHNAEFGEDNAALLDALRDAAPDIIVISGDIIDSRHTDVEIAASFAEAAVEIAPVYYVTGNHEGRIPEDAAVLEKRMTATGVSVLHNERTFFYRGEDRIALIGMDDPSMTADVGAFREQLRVLSDPAYFSVLLSHRPDLFDIYCDAGADLVFSGHAHGGQFRLPLLGGIFAPNQGFFPDYTEGCYTKGDTTMVVSRGLGNSLFPFRVNNPPEIVIISLQGR